MYFQSEIYKIIVAFPFAADASGEAWLDLPFDNGKIGTGLFILRKDYRLDNGEKTFEHDRFAVVRSLSGRHRWKEIFGNIYAHEPQRSDHIRRLQRYIRIGIHNAYHVYENRGERVHYERFGFDPPGLMAVRFQENIRRNNRTETVSFFLRDTQLPVYIPLWLTEAISR